MKAYHKIQTVLKRDPRTNYKTLVEGEVSLPEFEYLMGNLWTFTEKVDGTNIRVTFDGREIAFGGKTDNASIPAFLIKKLQDRFLPQAQKFVEKFGGETTGVCLYGEGYGAKIQKGGGNYRQDPDFVLFDVKIGEWWLKRVDVEDVARFFDLDIVPIIGEGTLIEMIDKARNGFNSMWGNFLAEGIVARPKVELLTRDGSRLIAKIKHKDFYHEKNR